MIPATFIDIIRKDAVFLRKADQLTYMIMRHFQQGRTFKRAAEFNGQADNNSMAMMYSRLSSTRLSLRPLILPMLTWSSCPSEVGILSALEGKQVFCFR